MADPALEQDQQDDAALMQALGREVKAYVDEAIASIPAAEQPVVNVAPSTATVQVNVPEQAAPVVEVNVPQLPAPVVNVETTPPIVNVAPAITIAQGSTIEVQATAPVVNVAPAAVSVDVNQADVVHAISESSNTSRDLILSLIESINANTSAIQAQNKILSAPKTIVADAGGKPIGVKVG